MLMRLGTIFFSKILVGCDFYSFGSQWQEPCHKIEPALVLNNTRYLKEVLNLGLCVYCCTTAPLTQNGIFKFHHRDRMRPNQALDSFFEQSLNQVLVCLALILKSTV